MIASPAARSALDILAVTLLAGVGIVGLADVYADPWYVISGATGTALGIGVVLVTRVIRATMLSGLVLLATGYLVLGTPAALSGGHVIELVPSLDSLRTVALGAVGCWRVVVTADVPMAASGPAALVPFLLCAVPSTVAFALAGRGRTVSTLIVMALPLVGSIALGTDRAVAPTVQGLVFAVVAIAYLALRGPSVAGPRFALIAGEAHAGGMLRRIATAVVVLAVAGGVAAAALPLTPAVHRANIRDAIQPLIDVSDLSTPLTLFHRLRTTARKDALFEISGVPAKAFVRLAVLDTYDGLSLGVARTGTGSGAFPIAAPADRPTERVRILKLSGVWVPTAGNAVVGVSGSGSGRIGVSHDTQTVVAGKGVRAGETFTIQVADRAPAAEASAGVTAQPGTPRAVPDRLADFIGRARSPLAQLTTMRTTFRKGYYSDGEVGQASSLPGHGSARITGLLTAKTMVGDGEQYAVAMALMADQLGLPSRVVMGFSPKVENGRATVRGEDVRALTEVLVGGTWHRYDPTPPKTRTTTDTTPKPKPKPAPQVQQPPPPIRSAHDSTPDSAAHTGVQRRATTIGAAWLPVALAIGTGSIALLALVLGPALVVGAIRALRSRRRRRAQHPLDRISGGWQEVLDRATGLGVPTSRADTRRERARVVDGALDAGAVQVAELADEQVFGPVEPTDEDARRFWAEVDGLVRRLDRASGRWTRLRARYGLGRVLVRRPTTPAEEDGR